MKKFIQMVLKMTKKKKKKKTKTKKQEGHDGPVSLHWLIHEIPS